MGTVIVLGSTITDLVARASRLPLPGEAVIGDDFATFLGGKGFNQAVAAARLGASVRLIGRVGTDVFGDSFSSALSNEGIDNSHLTRDPNTGTGTACVMIGTDTGQNAIIVLPRANLALTPKWLRKLSNPSSYNLLPRQIHAFSWPNARCVWPLSPRD